MCLSGLPRTGSTLLSGLLSQNPTIHAEGNSGLCQIMWDTQQSCEHFAKEQLTANNRLHSVKDIVSQLPHSYYKGNDPKESIVVDKCRSWALPANMQIYGWSPEEINWQHPHLDLAQIYAALTYYHDHRSAMDTEIRKSSEAANAAACLASDSPLARRLRGLAFP